MVVGRPGFDLRVMAFEGNARLPAPEAMPPVGWAKRSVPVMRETGLFAGAKPLAPAARRIRTTRGGART
jgi:hypothetical protein